MTLADILVVMNGGSVEQIGKPMDIYRRPETTFVASFIGAPPMNLLSLKQIARHRRQFRPPADAGIVGVRPEDLSFSTDGKPDGGLALDLKVEAVERIGAETFVYGTAARDPGVAANPGELPPGEVIVRIPARSRPPSASDHGGRLPGEAACVYRRRPPADRPLARPCDSGSGIAGPLVTETRISPAVPEGS